MSDGKDKAPGFLTSTPEVSFSYEAWAPGFRKVPGVSYLLPRPAGHTFAWCSPGHSCLSGLPAHVAGSCPTSHPPAPPSPPHLHPPACLGAGGCPDPKDAALCTWPCWTWWASQGPTSRVHPGPSGWHPMPLVLANLPRVHLIPLSKSFLT